MSVMGCLLTRFNITIPEKKRFQTTSLDTQS
nr:MAG TPA: hypothetical protein [Caudoviricetes sp.]DAH87078.1 MAG TPA: hypothetical protein [Caudoviricetes sp.]